MLAQLDLNERLERLEQPTKSPTAAPARPGRIPATAVEAPRMRRWLPIAIVLTAAAADAAGEPGLSSSLVLAAVPVTAIGALIAFGELLDARAVAPVEPASMLEPFLFAAALLLLVVGAAAGAPTFAISGCLAVFGLQALLGLSVELRRPALER